MNPFVFETLLLVFFLKKCCSRDVTKHVCYCNLTFHCTRFRNLFHRHFPLLATVSSKICTKIIGDKVLIAAVFEERDAKESVKISSACFSLGLERNESHSSEDRNYRVNHRLSSHSNIFITFIHWCGAEAVGYPE